MDVKYYIIIQVTHQYEEQVHVYRFRLVPAGNPNVRWKIKVYGFFLGGGVLFNRKECFAQSDSYNLLIHQNEDDSVIWYSRT